MKTFILVAILLSQSLSASTAAVEEVSTSYMITEEELAAAEAPDANATAEANSNAVVYTTAQQKEPSTWEKKVMLAIAAPVVAAGVVVTAIVLAPIWLVSKAIGKK
jgi:hypothetical protein